MSQYYVGVKQVFAWPEEKDGKPGYAVNYRYGQPDAYRSWSPKDEFERFYLPQGNDPTRITPEMVDAATEFNAPVKMGDKAAVVMGVMKTGGFEIVESAICVDPANFNPAVGAELCHKRIKDQAWRLLGFALQWARFGMK